jgi:cell division septation protein DedD
MSRILRNSEMRWFLAAFVLTTASLAAAFFLRAANGPVRVNAPDRTPVYTEGAFTFSAPQQLGGKPISPIFFQADAEPEIKSDLFGNIYVTAINGVPGGVDLWKSTDNGGGFTYLGQPDGAQDKCSAATPQCIAAESADDSIDVSEGGYLYVSSLYIGSVTFATSMDGGTGGVQPGQAWTVNPVSTGVPIEDRQWIAAYGPQTVYMTVRQAPGTGRLLFTKSTDAGKTFSAPILLTSADSTEGNLVVDPYTGYLYTTFIPSSAPNRIDLLKSVDGGATWTTKTGVFTGAAGENPGHKFTILAVDRGGNLHLVFGLKKADGSYHVYLTSSPNDTDSNTPEVGAGDTWLGAVQVDDGTGNTKTAVMPWVVAGSPGVVDITWLGSPAATAEGTASNWHVFFAQTRNALDTIAPSFAQNQVETATIHDQDICFNGSGCADNPSMTPGNRELLEYYTMAIDPDGNAHIAYPDSVNNCPTDTCKTNTWYTKQTAGNGVTAPPSAPAAATFSPNIEVGSPGAEPSIWVDSHNCIYVSAPGNPWSWKSENNGLSFLSPTNPVADEPTLTGGDEDVITIPQPNGARPDHVYYTDLGLSSDHIRKSTDGGATWFKPGPGGAAGDTGISSDRQWLAVDRIGTDQYVYEVDHELASEAIRLSSSVNDNPWVTQAAMTDPELSTTIPNTNPGPTFVDKTTHNVYGVFNASIPTNNAANPPFGKLLNIWNFVAPPSAVAGGPPGPFTNYPVHKGVIDSPTTPPPPAGTQTFGTNNANIFPAADIDSAGNIYVVWSMNNSRTNEFSIWFASSHDQGKTFYGPFPVSSGSLSADETSVLPWIAAGDNGRVDIVWYKSNSVGDPNTMPDGSQWNVMFAQSVNANSREPVFTVSKASDHVMHVGSISTGGLIGSSDRSLLDYFEVAIGPDGLANIIYADNGNGATHAEFTRQNGGPLARTNPTSPTCIDTSATPTPTATATATASATGTPAPTATATATATASPSGTPAPTPTATATATATSTPVNVQLLNISGRVFAETGDRIGIGGFIISGASPTKKVILRAIGPSMKNGANPVPGRLADPVLELHASDGHTIRANDNWREGQETEIQQSGLAPSDNKEAAIIAPLPDGSYTAQIAGAANSTGIGLIEIYDLESNKAGELGNLAVRADVKTGDNVLINGLILGGGTPKRVAFRALGPSLQAQLGAAVLQDPILELHDANGVTLMSNDDWQQASNASEIQAAGLAPSNNKESAILMTLPPSNYTSIVRGVGNGTGIGVAEAYKLNN